MSDETIGEKHWGNGRRRRGGTREQEVSDSTSLTEKAAHSQIINNAAAINGAVHKESAYGIMGNIASCMNRARLGMMRRIVGSGLRERLIRKIREA
jgi:hypothetical protein